MLSSGLLDRFLGRKPDPKKAPPKQPQRPPSRRDPSVQYGSSSSTTAASNFNAASPFNPNGVPQPSGNAAIANAQAAIEKTQASVQQAVQTIRPSVNTTPILAGVVEPFPNWVREQLNDPLNYHQQQHYRPNEGDDMDILAGNLYG